MALDNPPGSPQPQSNERISASPLHGEWGKRLLIAACLAILLSGALVRVKLFRDYRSLSLDEACLTMNILNRPFAGLIQPLEESQSAPFGFLFLLKAATLLFGEGEDGMRGLPLLAAILSIIMFTWLAYLLFIQYGPPLRRPAFWTAIILFALHPALIHYAVEVKQYSTDVLVAISLLALGLLFLRGNRGWGACAGMAFAGMAGILLSHPSVFTLGGIGLAWCREVWE